MEDPTVTTARLTATAKDVVDQARVIAKEAVANASDTKNFTAAKLINSYVKAIDLAITGALQATKDVLGVEAPKDGSTLPTPEAAEGRKLVADAMEAIGRRMLRQASKVAQDTASDLDKNPNGPTVWAKSMVKLADIALLGGIELAETALIGPAPFEKAPVVSNHYPVGGAGNRKLKVRAPGLCRPGTVDPIPSDKLRFFTVVGSKDVELTDATLGGAHNEFYISVHPGGMISGMYVGNVDVVNNAGAVLQTVAVEVPL